MTNTLISKDFSYQSSITSNNMTKRFSIVCWNKTKRFSIFIKQTVNRFLVSACPKGSTSLGLHLSQCLSADQFQVDFETQCFAACWSLDYQWCCDKVPAAIALFLFPLYLGQATVTCVPSRFGPVMVHVPVKQLWFLNCGYSIPFISQVFSLCMTHFGRSCLLDQPELSIQNYRQKMLQTLYEDYSK